MAVKPVGFHKTFSEKGLSGLKLLFKFSLLL